MPRLNDLVREAKRAVRGPTQPYNTALVREICNDIGTLKSIANPNNIPKSNGLKTQNDLNSAAELQFISLLTSGIETRGKRALRIYHYPRVRRVRDVFWEKGLLKKEVEKKLSAPEINFFSEYSKLAGDYLNFYESINGKWSLDPPKDLFTTTRVVRSAGDIMTEEGQLHLTTGYMVAMRLETEALVFDNYLKLLDR
ncbi:hypothetical protein G9A89_007039 [Geosiphon pyriformis]|nr:hypothetical protein G9A89_007039 [Geosiphon pyriformis]